jgi:hypothetical protein
MTVRLQTADGEIKEYPTARGVGCLPRGDDYYDYEKWVTKCGKEWPKEPGLHQDCEHLECAIYLAECERCQKDGSFYLAAIAAIFLAISIMAKNIIVLFSLMFFVVFALASIIHYGMGLKSEENFNELAEYRDKGTINGTKAFQIFKDPRSR